MHRSDSQILLQCESVSKKFCRNLKKSLWYGIKDSVAEIFGHKRDTHLRKHEFWALNDVSFEVGRGECIGLLGRNGAGKTTLLKVLSGLIKPDKGEVTLYAKVGGLIALGAGFNGILSGRENVHINGSILGYSKKQINQKMDEIIAFSELGDFIDAPVQTYSSGMSVRLGFAIAAILTKPEILLLDEVLAVGDMAFTIKCLNSVRNMMKDSAVVFVSHNMQYVSQFCTSTINFENGNVYGKYSEVSEGINAYISRQSICAAQTESPFIKITENCFFINEKIIADFEPLVGPKDDVSISFRITFLKSSVTSRLKIYLANQYNEPVVSFCVPDEFIISRSCKIRFPIGCLNLSKGKYSFIIGINDIDLNQNLIRVSNFMPFQSITDSYDWCPVLQQIYPSIVV